MSAEYKVTKGIYTRKYQAKNIWEVGGACVEKQGKIHSTHGLCEFGRCCASVVWVSHKLRTTWMCCASVVRVSHKLGAIVFRMPYLPYFSSKSYTVWSIRFLTSWDLKWYISHRKWTSRSAPKVRNNTVAVVLCFLHFACFSSLLYSFTWLALMIQKAVKTLKLATNMIRRHC